MSTNALLCRVPERRRELVGQTRWNGIDYLEVDDDQLGLTVYFFAAPPEDLGIANIRIDGGRRITGIRALAVAAVADAAAVHIALDRYGDFSTYTLRLIEAPIVNEPADEKTLAGFDPRYASLDFNFKIECPGDFDCATATPCPPAALTTPNIDYLAKDYETFRQLMLDRLAVTMPDWRERHVPDIGITLVELLAYAADQLSYYQDAVSAEAYLDTARTRISVRRHARLVDYRLHEGCNARAWLAISCGADVSLGGDTYFVTRHAEVARRAHGQTLREEDLEAVDASLYEVFAPVTEPPNADIALVALHSTIRFYTWGDQECCLPKGATRATLLDEAPPAATDGQATPAQKSEKSDASASADGSKTYAAVAEPKRILKLKVGDVLIFEEVLGPTTGNPADADPAHRHAVRITRITERTDALLGHLVLDIEWAQADALPFALCVSARLPAPDCARIGDISVARGNVILVDHGRRREQPLGSVEPGSVVAECGCDGVVPESATRPATFVPALEWAPLTHRETPLLTGPATTTLQQDPQRASADITITETVFTPGASGGGWSVRNDLLASEAGARDVVVEVDDDGIGHLRFGDGRCGRQPAAGSAFSAKYRTGNGLAGNVPAGAIGYAVFVSRVIDDPDFAVRNPLPAQGGIAPETLAHAKLAAPHAFRARLLRAITADDYARLAENDPKLQRANARLVWPGSWYEAAVAIDPLGSEVATSALCREIDRKLERYRRLGHDLAVRPARYVALRVRLQVCVKPEYLRGHVAAAIDEALSSHRHADGSLGFFHPDRLSFGEDIYASDLIAAVQSIDGVESVALLQLSRLDRPPDTGAAPDVLRLAPFEIAQLDNDPSFPEHGKLDLNLGGGR